MTPKAYPNEYNDELKKATREAIEQALFILLKTKSFDKISISELVNKAGVSRTAWYSNYSSMEDVFTSYIVRDLGSMLATFAGKPFSELPNFLNSFLQHIYEERVIYKTLYERELDGIFLKTTNEVFVAGNPLETTFWAGGLYNLISQWVKSDFAYPIEELTRICVVYAKPVFK